MPSFVFFCLTVCGSACKLCDVNGPGKCDSDKCFAEYVYNAADKSCKRETGVSITQLISYLSYTTQQVSRTDSESIKKRFRTDQ